MKRPGLAFLLALALLVILASATIARAAPEDSHPPTADSDDGMAVIDLLVAYTSQAGVEAANIDALIRHAIDQTNWILAISRIRARLRLAHRYQTDYAQQEDVYEDLVYLQSPGDGFLDEVHAIRDQHGADLVVLFRGRHRNQCESASSYWRYSPDSNAFGVVPHNCVGNYGLARAIGRNLGAYNDYDPPFENYNFPYGHSFCNDKGNWRTLMSWNRGNSCPVVQPYFSNPDVSFMGTPTGDADIRNNARVINEIAPIAASYRDASPSLAVPLVASADNANQQGFVRIINHSNRAGSVRIHAIDDTGLRFDPVELSLDGKQTRHFNSGDLEDGNPSKGLSGGVGDGNGNWRLELETELDIEHLAYIRTPDGFLTSIHAVAALAADDGSMHHYVPIFNPANNFDQQSRLRLVNTGDSAASVRIDGRDDAGDAPPEGSVSLTLDPGAAHLITARELEQGSEDSSGQFGAGAGKWQLFVSSDQPIEVMSLLLSPTGNLTNLSP